MSEATEPKRARSCHTERETQDGGPGPLPDTALNSGSHGCLVEEEG